MADRWTGAAADLVRELDETRLVDHHVHGALRDAPSRTAYGDSLNEVDTDPLPPQTNPFDSQIGVAIRAWCAPVLGLERHASADDYWTVRAALSEDEVNRRFLTAAGVSHWLVDTGFRTDDLLSPAALAEAGGGHAVEIVRLESLAEQVVADGVTPSTYAARFRELLERRSLGAVAAKSVLAYRAGFDVDLGRPGDREVEHHVDAWLHRGDPARLADPRLIAFGLHEAADLGLPIQLHVGLGDRDMHLRRSDPLLLTDLLRDPSIARVPVLLLHCYPFEREAGYLAQGFRNVFLDVGLAVNHLGARSAALVARSLELAPFDKVLYSSDACGPSELHFLGARLWRNAMATVLGRFVDDDEWSLDDARRVIGMTARDNAFRAYDRLAEQPG
ncbi:amidohydrolase family protein [Terrabacter sp. MAHUQ-38]|uniref:amidohydrolase family protein n=1 Tax=unclassified Terrabacter TaxID=2630222 RepID=UPI00165E4996|nr:amidohydrolase family protein [Terrabacter sp. MAHUQ-38]MBC9820281.1 amidohydrolase family protein [Terrabacter sp. MAHUQ-38]